MGDKGTSVSCRLGRQAWQKRRQGQEWCPDAWCRVRSQPSCAAACFKTAWDRFQCSALILHQSVPYFFAACLANQSHPTARITARGKGLDVPAHQNYPDPLPPVHESALMCVVRTRTKQHHTVVLTGADHAPAQPSGPALFLSATPALSSLPNPTTPPPTANSLAEASETNQGAPG